MSTLRVSNIEAKADPSSPSVDEKLKVTNSNGDVLVHIDGKTAGITTVGINTTDSSFTVDAAQNIKFIGIVTATKFSLSGGGEITGGDGNFTGIVTAASIDATSATFSGNVSIGGTLTYEDVTSIDSIGIVTAQSDVHVGAGLSVVGISTLANTNVNGQLTASNSNVTGVSTLGNTVIGTGTTELIVTGNARVTGSLTATNFSGNLTGNVTGNVTGESTLSGISSSISDTAVDVFVYDTSKDSDGGAWRKRTQNTSWYNETLGTATRGTRKEFPTVAVLVLSANKLTIYDGDDPDLPMWMEVYQYVGGGNSGTTTNWHGGSGTFSAVAAINGIIICGTNGTRNLHFVNDRFSLFYSPESGNYTQLGGISNRNVAYSSWGPSDQYYAQLVNTAVNDVAMTVLPNAPVDSATGLPVPTIAVGTQLGVSVIKDDGNVYDFSGFNPIDTVHIDSNNVIASVNTGNIDYIFKTSIPNADKQYNDDITAGSKNYYMTSNSGTIPLMRDINVACTAYDSKDDVVYRGGNAGFDIIRAGVNYSQTHSNPSIAYISKDYNTGYMVGDIKGAFLSDTSTTNLTGGNLVTNGDAWSGALSSTSSTPPTGWTGALGAKFRTNSGGDGTYINLVNAGSAQGGPNSYMYQAITTVAGRRYKISLTQIHHATITVFFAVATTSGGTDLLNTSFTSASGNTPRELFGEFTATGTTTYIRLGVISASNDYWVGWDNVVVTEVDEDRSVNAHGLHSFGTVTKTPVATGAELVAYSGFSASNYLQQSNNTDYSFGTGDFYVMTWVYPLGTSSLYDFMLELNDASTSNRFFLIRNPNGRVYVPWNTDVTGSELPLNKWSCVVAQRKSGTGEIYINGEFILSNAWTSNNNLTQTGGTYIGVYPTGGSSIQYPLDGKLSLMRIGAGAISPEQIKKIYEDEKVLFHENAKATLYGSSDAVTALAYDEVTDQLHVGTSAGRSDFQGLRRINNTTTAVTTAISAHDEFIIEQ